MSRTRAGLVALLAGFAVMSLELTAVRVLAPHFGDSAYVWTNVIGVMLVALAIGAWLGGQMADRQTGASRASGLTLIAGLLTVVVPLLAPWLGGWLLPQNLPLDDAMPALVRGSLGATILLFAPPVMLLGCLTPILVTALASAHGRVGEASGLVGAASTVGSLLGTFATTHALVPGLGSRITIWLCAAIILLCSALLHGRAVRAAVVLVPLALMPWSWGALRAPGPGQELIAERESAYQFLQVVRDAAAEPAITSLKINEGLDSFHSVRIDGTAFTGGRYYDYHAAVPFLVGDGKRPDPLRVLSLGAAAGTFARLFHAAHPGCVVDGVELDPAVVELGEQHFGGRPGRGRIYAGLDARVFVDHAAGPYELILVDAYERQIYLPAHVASRQFFAAVRGLLRPGGVVSVNSGGRGFDDPVLVALARTMATEFGSSWAYRVPSTRNFMLLARRDAALDPAVLARIRDEPAALRAILAAAAMAGSWRRFGPAEPVLDDDRPLLDTLQETALGLRPGFPGLTPMAGRRDPAEVEQTVRAQLGDADHDGALASLRTSRAPTAMLRTLAGDVRWWMRDLEGADAEYGAALADADGELRTFVEGRRERLGAELEGLRDARRVSARNGLVAVLSALALGGLAFGLHRTVGGARL